MHSSSDSTASVRPLRVMAVALALLGVVPMANLVAQGGGLAWWSPSVRLWTIWSAITICVALGLARFAPAACDAVGEACSRWLLRPSAVSFAAIAGIAATLLAVYFSWRLFGFQPVTMDELSAQWQAEMLTQGRLFASAERHPEFFGTMQTLQAGPRWLTHYPIGVPTLLSLGAAVGAPWLVNPVLVGLATAVVYLFARRTSTEVQARGVTLLFVLSPFVLFMAASQLDHVGTMLFVWLALAALVAWHRAADAAQARRRAAVIGLSLGMAATIRPYDAALVALAIGFFQLRAAVGNPILTRSLATQLVAGTIPVAILLACNAATTGHPLTFAYELLNGAEHGPGFHVDPFGALHTPRRGIYNVSAYLMRLDVTLLAWPVPALLLVALALAGQRRATRWDHLLLGVLAMVLLGYWAYWGEGRSLGPRFLFTAAPVFLVFVARFPGVLRDRAPTPLTRRAAAVLVPIWVLAAWLTPPMAAQPVGVWTLAERARERDVATRLVTDAVAGQGITNALVLVADGWHARLASRLRALGARPFMAQRIVGTYDACMLEQLLDSAERTPELARRQTEFVFAELDRAPAAVPVRGLPALEQLALDASRARPARCSAELASARSNGVDLARFLPLMRLDSAGRLDGPVVYARDHGDRNALLLERFADRAWYSARVDRVGDRLVAIITPIRRP